MSTGTNKERLEQNNTLLEDIKTQIQNLPQAGGSGDVKLFETQEQMQADTTAKEGDLAIVYRKDGSTFEGLYKYSNSSWSLAPTQLSAIADYVYEKVFYGKNGVETGTLQNKENLTKDEVKRRVDIWSDYNSGIVCPSDVSVMFKNCTNLTTIPLLNTSSVTTMYHMFENCTNLTTIPLLNTSKVTNMVMMFSGCTNLAEIPELDTSNVTNMYYTFSGCKNLTTIPLLNTSKVTGMMYMFHGCTSLSDKSLNNILAMCANATGANVKTLKFIGLTSEQANKCKTLSNYSAFTAAGWTTGY